MRHITELERMVNRATATTGRTDYGSRDYQVRNRRTSALRHRLNRKLREQDRRVN